MDAVVVLCVLDTSLHGQCLFYRCSPVIDPRLGLPLQRWDVSLIVFLAGLFSACYYILLESNPHFGYDICCSAVANKNSQTYRHLWPPDPTFHHSLHETPWTWPFILRSHHCWSRLRLSSTLSMDQANQHWVAWGCQATSILVWLYNLKGFYKCFKLLYHLPLTTPHHKNQSTNNQLSFPPSALYRVDLILSLLQALHCFWSKMAKFLENCAAYQRYLKEVASGELEMPEYETVSK